MYIIIFTQHVRTIVYYNNSDKIECACPKGFELGPKYSPLIYAGMCSVCVYLLMLQFCMFVLFSGSAWASPALPHSEGHDRPPYPLCPPREQTGVPVRFPQVRHSFPPLFPSHGSCLWYESLYETPNCRILGSCVTLFAVTGLYPIESDQEGTNQFQNWSGLTFP